MLALQHDGLAILTSHGQRVTIDELTRLTRRTATITQRLLQIARHSQANVDGLVIQTYLAALEVDIETLIDVVQLRAIKERTQHLPLRAPTMRRKLPLSTDVKHAVPVDHFDVRGLPR